MPPARRRRQHERHPTFEQYATLEHEALSAANREQGIGVRLFLLGTSFCYYIVLTPAYTFLLKIAEDFTPMIPVKEYMDLTLAMLLGFGLVFEMPVIIAFLALFGLVSPRFLWTKFKYAVIIMVAVAAIISPTGDAFNLLLWTAPMIVLYIISIGIAALFAARRKKRERS